MAMKEHPFVVTTTFQGDGTTIKYEKNKPNRSDAVGKAFKINPTTGKGELVEDGDEIDGKVLDVDDDHKFTAAYIFGGLTLPLGTGVTTIARGSKVVGALGASSAKGHVKAAPAVDTSAGDEATLATSVVNALKGKGSVHKTDTTHALVAFGGK